jgi:hypothetical protein
MKTNKRISLAAILFAILSFTNPLPATVIYQDTFSGPAATMNGRVPDTVSNGTNWASSIVTQFAVDGAGSGILSAATGSSAGSAGPTLPFTPDGSSVYVLSVDLVGFGDVNANHWFTLGFTATNNGVGWFTAGNGGRAAVLIAPLGSPNNQAQTFCASNGTANGINFNNANPEPGTYTLILDSSSGNLLFQNPNGVLRAFKLSSTDMSSIKSVQLSAGSSTPVGLVFDDFLLQTTNITTPIVAPVLISGASTINLPVSSNVFSGTTLSLSGGAIGATSYDWVTDNGSGGTTWTSLGSNTNILTVNTTPLSAGNYQYALVASNSFGMVTSSVPATISVVVSAPTLVADIFPTNRTTYTTKAASFTASFTGSLPLSYLWQYSPNPDGSGAVMVTNLAVISNNSVLLTNLTLPEDGYYSVQASNFLGTLNSGWARLNVLNSAAQTNALFIDSFSRVVALNGTTADVTNSAGAWSAVTGWTTTGSEGRATGISSGNSGHISALPITLTAGKVYQVSFEILSLTGTAANWVGWGFFNSINSSSTLFGNEVAVALAQVNGTGQSFYGLPSLSHASTVAGTGGVGQYAVRLTVLGSGAAVVEFIRNGIVLRTGSLTTAEVTAITGVGLSAQSSVTTTFDNFRVENLAFPATPTVGSPILFPSSTVYAGTPVTVNVSAGGQTPLFYQWQADNGSGGVTFDNTGGNSTNLAVDTTSLLGAYQYQVIVTNLYGSITSAPVTLTVNPASAPLLTKDTRPTCVQDVPVGQNASFLARFDGTQPISYQWQFSTDSGGAGATNISGATNVLLTLTNVQNANAGYYSLQATNTVSPFVANSTWSQLTVHAGANQLTNSATLAYIYEDSFSRGGNLAFTAPDVVDTTGEVWYGANTVFKTDGDQLNVIGTGVAHIALVPASNTTYSVSALLIPVCGNGSSSCTLGFNTATGTSFPGDSGWIAYATSLGDGTGQTYAGASTASGSGTANSVGGPGTYTLQLAVAGDGSGTVLYAKNSEIYATNILTSAQVNTIRSIAVLGITSGGAIDNVSLASYPTVTVNTASTNIVFSASGGDLTLSWPADHTGWTLQMNTNLVTTNWVPIGGSSATNQMIIPISPAIPTVFYRLVYP